MELPSNGNKSSWTREKKKFSARGISLVNQTWSWKANILLQTDIMIGGVEFFKCHIIIISKTENKYTNVYLVWVLSMQIYWWQKASLRRVCLPKNKLHESRMLCFRKCKFRATTGIMTKPLWISLDEWLKNGLDSNEKLES